MSPELTLSLLATGASMGLVALAVRARSLSRTPRRRAENLGSVVEPERSRLALGVERLGRFLLRRILPAGRTVDSVEARRIGWAVLGGLAIAAVAGPLVGGFGGAFAAWAPGALDRRRTRHRIAGFARDLPEVVDLFALALGSGLNVSLAVTAVGQRATGDLGGELARASAEVDRGRRLADALEELPTRCGEALRPLVTLLAAGERYGVPLVESLDRLAVDVRANERRHAEEVARRLPVKMLFPLVVCILPAFGLLTLGPMLVTSFPSLTF